MESQSQIGVILRKSPYGESDLIITALLAENGLRRFFAKGALVSRKRFGGRLELFTQVKLRYRVKAEGLWMLTEAESVAGVSVNWSEPSAFAAAGFFAELICTFHPEGESSTAVAEFWMTFESHVRESGGLGLSPDRLLVAFWQLLGFFGYALSVMACVRCKESQGSGRFQPEQGGFVCQFCLQRPQGPTLDESVRGRLSASLPVPAKLIVELFGETLSFVEDILHKRLKAASFFRSILEG